MPRMLKLPSVLAVIVSATMASGCASLFQQAAPPPVRLELPAIVTTPCRLHTLPESPTWADLEAGYAIRGEQLVACELARQTAVFVLQTERGD